MTWRIDERLVHLSAYLEISFCLFDELMDISWRKRRAIVDFAYHNSEFYRKLYKCAGFHPSDLKTRDDFSSIPLVDKEDLRANLYSNIIGAKRHRRIVSTGGSTGSPLSVFHDVRFPGEAMHWLVKSWWGVHPGENEGICLREVRRDFRAQLLNRLIWWPTRRCKLDASTMSTSSVMKFIKDVNSIKPSLIWGYVGAVDQVASVILETGMKVHAPKYLSLTSSPISLVQRSRIESAFQASVCNQYGCCEVHWLAAECPAQCGLHVFADCRHIEVVDPNDRPSPSEEIGTTVITDLTNHVFPIIRYKLGDRTRFLGTSCDCGRTLPLIEDVKGRESDSVVLPDGALVSGDYLTTIFDDHVAAVKRFQVVQQEDYSISVRVVVGSDCDSLGEALESVRDRLKEVVHRKVPVSIERVDDIPDFRGKLKFIISNARQPK